MIGFPKEFPEGVGFLKGLFFLVFISVLKCNHNEHNGASGQDGQEIVHVINAVLMNYFFKKIFYLKS
jgi:hypothetical protein